MGLFDRRNKRNRFDLKVSYAGRSDIAKALNFDPLNDSDRASMIKAMGFPMTDGIPLDVLQAAFSSLYSNIRSGIKLNEKKMVDRSFAGIYQTILYPVSGGKIEFMYNSNSRHGTREFWFDLSCDLEMTKDIFVSTILLPTLDELKEKGFHFHI